MASLNDSEVSACDISGAYLNVLAGEKVWYVAGEASGEMKGTAMIITRVLYGLKMSAKAWRLFFAVSLKEMRYTSCLADPDAYTKKEANKEVYKYWSYMLVYVGDFLCIHHKLDQVMEDLKSRYKLKGDAYGAPERYLGKNVEKYQLDDGKEYWIMHAGDYLK